MNQNSPNPETIFAAAIQITAPEERAAYLDQACCNNPELRHDVEKLIIDYFRAGSFLQRPAADFEPAADDLYATIEGLQFADTPGTVIGPYKLLQQIGEGGFGVVYMAEQTEPVHRRVALKIIKPGMDSRQIIARFEAERQALALMDHPNIAKVFDAGTIGSELDAPARADRSGSFGRPYFVMELVKGLPITKYCDEHHLTPRRRLELFVPVCQAVQHAHQKGIIHRDLKPSNVLVAEYDDKPVVKVIDFGVAKATGSKLTDRTMFTEFGQVLGTLEYMSPEQAKFNALDIDTRSDIYALGVLLYELLTGTTPFERKRLREAAFDEMLRIIREEEPPKPSTRITKTEKLPSIAANRGSEPRKLSGLVRGELDWIVMKAIEKDRNRRYETANGLAMDVQRYLADEQVQACPPSASYRLRKFARKYRTLLRIAGLFVVFLVLAVAVSTWQAVRPTLAEGRALAERDRAEASFRMARDAVDQLFTQVSQSPKLRAYGMEKFRKELLQSSRQFHERFIREQFDTPGVRYDLALAYHQLTDINRELGDTAAAEEASSKATALLEELAAAQPDVPEYQRDLAASHAALGRLYMNTASWDKAEAAYQQALSIQDSQAHAYPDAPEYEYALAKTYSDLVVVHSKQDRGDLAATMCRRAQESLSRLLQENKDNPRASEYKKLLAATLRNLGEEYLIRNLLDKAETPLMEAQNIYQELVKSQDLPEHWQGLARSQAQLGMVYRDRAGAAGKAEELQQRALEIFKKLTSEHQLVPEYAYDQGRCYGVMGQTADHEGRYVVALDRYDKSIEIMQALRDKDFRRAGLMLLDTRILRAITLAKKGDHKRATSEAEAVARQKDLQAVQLYNIACAFALSSETSQRDSNLSASERPPLKVLYANQAMDFLHQAVDKGWTMGYLDRRLAQMQDDHDLDPLRGRDDFQKLLADLKAKAKE